jgi:hypothetical protein
MAETLDKPSNMDRISDIWGLYALSVRNGMSSLMGQAAYGARGRDLIALVSRCDEQTAAQLAWLGMRVKAPAPQALLVGS